jgi:hypothetical protein
VLGRDPECAFLVLCRVDCMPIPETRRKNEDQLVDPKAHAGESNSIRPELDNVDASGEWSVRERPLRALVFVQRPIGTLWLVLVHGLCFLHTTTSFASTASTATTITVATAAASSPTCAAASRLYRRHRRHRPIRRRFLCRLQGMVHGPCEDHLCLPVVPLQGLWHLHTSSSSSASFPASTTCSQAAATVAATSATTDHVQSSFVLGVGAHCAVRSRLPRRVRARHPVDGHVASGDDRVDVVRGPCRCDAALATVRAARPAHVFPISGSFCLFAGRAAERCAYAPPARQGAVAAARQHSHAWWEDDPARQPEGA